MGRFGEDKIREQVLNNDHIELGETKIDYLVVNDYMTAKILLLK